MIAPEDESVVECSCASCETAWCVAVNAGQTMRLVLHPPLPGADAPLRILAPHTAGAPWSRHRPT